MWVTLLISTRQSEQISFCVTVLNLVHYSKSHLTRTNIVYRSANQSRPAMIHTYQDRVLI